MSIGPEVDEKTLDKLRKLMAMRDAAGTTEAEAQAFAAKVAENDGTSR